MKYFVYKISKKDRKPTYGKTFGDSIAIAIENIMHYEKIDKSILKVKEVSKSLFSFEPKKLYELYNKDFVVKMVNRRAVKILGYVGHSARIKYVDTGQECTVSRTVIREYTPKTKQFK